MDFTQLQAGFSLMIVGMSTVFIFLTILVVSTSLMSRLVMRLQPAVEGTPDKVTREEVAAITAAINQHRGAPRRHVSPAE